MWDYAYKRSLAANQKTGPDGAVAMSSANGLGSRLGAGLLLTTNLLSYTDNPVRAGVCAHDRRVL